MYVKVNKGNSLLYILSVFRIVISRCSFVSGYFLLDRGSPT